jgi:hypothetical protein
MALSSGKWNERTVSQTCYFFPFRVSEVAVLPASPNEGWLEVIHEERVMWFHHPATLRRSKNGQLRVSVPIPLIVDSPRRLEMNKS